MRLRIERNALIVDLEREHRCLSSAVMGGGMGTVRTWVNLQVPPDYERTDPDSHVREHSLSMPGPVVGMLTAADVNGRIVRVSGDAVVVATVGLGHPLAAVGSRPVAVPRFGTINMLVVSRIPLTAEALVGAIQTAVEAKAQALADAGVPALNSGGTATGTATDSICAACPFGDGLPFAGTATSIGADIARAVYGCVSAGASRRSVQNGGLQEWVR